MSDPLLLPTSSWTDIPALDVRFAASSCTLPVVAWGSLPRRSRLPGGTWHYYVQDERFSRMWARRDDPLATCATATVEVNYSILDHTPLPEALWHTYRKRWLARYWGERGLDVWVDLNVAPAFSELNLVGVPQGWPSYSTRAYADRLEDLDAEYSVARERCGREPRLLVIGGGDAARDICQRRGWLHVDDRTREVMRGLREVANVQGIRIGDVGSTAADAGAFVPEVGDAP